MWNHIFHILKVANNNEAFIVFAWNHFTHMFIVCTYHYLLYFGHLNSINSSKNSTQRKCKEDLNEQFMVSWTNPQVLAL